METEIGRLSCDLRWYVEQFTHTRLFTQSEIFRTLIDNPGLDIRLVGINVNVDVQKSKIFFGEFEDDNLSCLYMTHDRIGKLRGLLKRGVIQVKKLTVDVINELTCVFIDSSDEVVLNLRNRCFVDESIRDKISCVVYDLDDHGCEFDNELYPTRLFSRQRHLLRLKMCNFDDLIGAFAVIKYFEKCDVVVIYEFQLCFGFSIIQSQHCLDFEKSVSKLITFLELMNVKAYSIDVLLTVRVGGNVNKTVECELRETARRIGLECITGVVVHGVHGSVVCDFSWVSECVKLETLKVTKSVECSIRTFGPLDRCEKLKSVEIESKDLCFDWLSVVKASKVEIRTNILKVNGVLKINRHVKVLYITDTLGSQEIDLRKLDLVDAVNLKVLKVKGSPIGDRHVKGLFKLPETCRFFIISTHRLIQIKHNVCVEPELWDRMHGVYVNHRVCRGSACGATMDPVCDLGSVGRAVVVE